MYSARDICVVGGVLEMGKIAALAQSHFVSIAPHNPMGPLATAINVHFCAAQTKSLIHVYRWPRVPGCVFGTGYLRGRRRARDGQDRGLGPIAFRVDSAAQSDGPAGDGHQRALLRRADHVPHTHVPLATLLELWIWQASV